MKSQIKIEINKNLSAIEIEGYRKQAITQIVEQYREKLMDKGYDLGNRGKWILRTSLQDKVKVEIITTLKVSVKELEKLLKS